MSDNSSTETTYEPPAINRIRHQMNAKSGQPLNSAKKLAHRDEIDGVDYDTLTQKYGSPLFVYSEKKIREVYQRATGAFAAEWPKTQFAWSYKTCYLKSICALYHQMGSKAEVVSSMEYDKARRLGVPASDIIFNGPWKPIPALERAAREGSRIHIDNFEEMADLEQVAETLGKEIPVAIRVNLNAGIYPQWGKFGFTLENGQAKSALLRIKQGGKLKLTGLHCHIGTFVLDPAAYGIAVNKLAGLASEAKEILGAELDYIDLGGGFPSRSALKGIYQPPEIAVPPIEAYAKVIGQALRTHFDPETGPELILETGRHLIDEAGYLISTVLGSKVMADSRRGYLIDSGVHLLYTNTWYNYTIESDRPGTGAAEPSCLNGSLCMNIDVIGEGHLLPRMERGTRLTFSPVGAYNVTQAMPFIHCRPGVAMVRETGESTLIRRAETIEDIESPELLPGDLEYHKG